MPAVRNRSKSSQSSGRRTRGCSSTTRPTSRSAWISGTPGPGAVEAGEPGGNREPSARRAPASRRGSRRNRGRRPRDSRKRMSASAPVPVAGSSARRAPARGEGEAILAVGHQQQPGRRVGDVGERLDDPLLERGLVAALAADRVGEAQPFLAIIVAMLEEMLGDDDPQPGPQPGGRQDDQGRGGHHHDQAELGEPAPVAADDLQRPRRRHHQDQIAEDRDHRERLEGRGARELDPPGRGAAARRARTRARAAPAPRRASRTDPRRRRG